MPGLVVASFPIMGMLSFEDVLQTLFWTGNKLYSTVQVIQLLSKYLLVIKDDDFKTSNNDALVVQIH